MKRTRILHLLLSLGVGGAERVAASIVKGSDPERFEHEVVCLDEIGVFGEELNRQGFRTTLLRRKPGVDWLLIPRLAAFLVRNRVDLVHAHGETPWFYGALACVLTMGRIKCITTVHGYGGGDRSRIDDYRLWRVLTRVSPKVVLVAENLRQELVSKGFSPRKIQTILNGVDIHKIAEFPRESRSRWGIDDKSTAIGIIARLSAVKNHQLLFRAVARLLKKDIPLKLVVVGDGPEGGSLRRLAEDLGIKERVVFCGAQDPAIGFYSAFDIFVLPSLSEGISMTLLEAMASRLPVVASRVGGNSEIITDGETGLLFESGDLDGLSEALWKLANDHQERERLSEGGFQTVQRLYSFERMIGEYHRLYQVVA